MSRLTTLVPLIAVCTAVSLPLSAADRVHDAEVPRLVAQVLVGTSGFEPGIAAEWRVGGDPLCVIRPEVFLNEDERAGFGASVQWQLSFLNLPERHAITIGPRVLYHNSDDSGWEADAMAIWHFDLVPTQRSRHYLEVIGAVGVLQDDSENNNESKSVIGASAGIAYGFQF